METDHEIEVERLLSNSSETYKDEEVKQEVEEKEEALSWCDLPIGKEISQSKKETNQENTSNQEDFDFSFSEESEMCSPDQVFFQGQILPFRHSITNFTTEHRRLSRSESMDTYHSNGFTSRSSSSRSSSIRSHQSLTSSGGSSSTTTPIYKPRVHNNFISHPTPKPQTRFSRTKKQNMQNSNHKSTIWSHFRLGIVSTPEIVLEDLKTRSTNNRNKKLQKSQSFNINDSSRFISEKKKKRGIFEVNGTFFSSCKCSSNAVDIIPSKKEVFAHEKRKGTKHQEGKQSISRLRTFEWLKQNSLDRTSSLRNDA